MKSSGYGLIFLIVMILTVPVYAQDYPVITVGYRELQLVPDDVADLSNNVRAFQSENVLIDLLEENSTTYWEELGAYDASFDTDPTLTSYAIVQINETGFYQTHVALDAETGDYQWSELLGTDMTENFSLAVTTATDFFADDGHYWGLSEEIVLVPGETVGLQIDAVWLFEFYLVGETERWTLLINTDGEIENFQFTDIPCQSCNDNTIIMIVSLSLLIVGLIAVGFFMKRNTI